MRSTTLTAAFAAALLGAAAPAAAQPPADDPTALAGFSVTAKKAGALSGLTVALPKRCLEARRPADPDLPPPKVVSTYPANGAVVRPGVLILRVTFDLPMTCDGLVASHAPWPNPCPGSVREALLTLDRRTFLMACVVHGKAHYGLWLNRGFEHRFTSLGGRTAAPYELLFETSDGPELTTIAEALAQDPDGPKRPAPAP